MKIEMNDKARDIMSRKEDAAYLGRNLFLEGEKFIKQMKSSNPLSKVNKLEATRLLMKDRAKSKKRQCRKEQNDLDASECSSGNVSMSQDASVLDMSTMSNRREDSRMREKERETKIAKMIKSSSYQNVMSAQKRKAAW